MTPSAMTSSSHRMSVCFPSGLGTASPARAVIVAATGSIASVDVRAFVDRVKADEERAPSLVHLRVLPARNPPLEPFPELPELLEDRLDLLGISGLYPHQRQ